MGAVAVCGAEGGFRPTTDTAVERSSSLAGSEPRSRGHQHAFRYNQSGRTDRNTGKYKSFGICNWRTLVRRCFNTCYGAE